MTTRTQLLELLAELSDACPEMRMGQLLANLATLARGAVPSAIWDAEDEELLEAARRLAEAFRSRHANVA
jgi:hypothetical protein